MAVPGQRFTTGAVVGRRPGEGRQSTRLGGLGVLARRSDVRDGWIADIRAEFPREPRHFFVRTGARGKKRLDPRDGCGAAVLTKIRESIKRR
jgi:hypothetical protein